MYGGSLLLPLYLQLVAGYEAAETGFWLLVMGLGSAIALPFAGSMIDRFGPGVITFLGAGMLVLSAAAFLLMLELSSLALCVLVVTRGIGIALAQMPAMTAAYSFVAKAEMGDATTIVNMIQPLGGAFGAIAIVIMLQQLGGSSDISVQRWSFASIVVVSLLTLVAAAIMIRRPEFHPDVANATESARQ